MEFAFFDTCSRHPDEDNADFVIADKMAPVRKRIQRILSVAAELGAPVLSTTCLGIQRGNPGMCAQSACACASAASAAAGRNEGGPAFVAMKATQADVATALQSREIVLERLSCKTPDDNVWRRTYDVFSINRNTAGIVRALGERHWLVFGAGFEHCLVTAVEGLRALGMRVTVLEDGCIHGGRSVPATFLRTFDRLKSAGAEWKSFEAICAENPKLQQIVSSLRKPRPVPAAERPAEMVSA
jgi:nicotinamidase-related amidase